MSDIVKAYKDRKKFLDMVKKYLIEAIRITESNTRGENGLAYDEVLEHIEEHRLNGWFRYIEERMEAEIGTIDD